MILSQGSKGYPLLFCSLKHEINNQMLCSQRLESLNNECLFKLSNISCKKKCIAPLKNVSVDFGGTFDTS